MSAIVASESRQRILDAIQGVLAINALPGDPQFARLGGLHTVETHLDTLIHIAQTTPDPADYPAVLRQFVCAQCLQGPRPECPLRRIDSCTLYRCATPILQAIVQVLQQPGQGAGTV